MSESYNSMGTDSDLVGEERFREAMCPARHTRATVNQSEAWMEKLTAMKGTLKESWTCVLCGERGTGKTQMAVELIRAHCFTNNKSCRYEKVMGFFMAIKKSYAKGSEKTEDRVISDYTQPDLLVIDEAHERSESEWENRLLTYLVDRRYDAMKKTLLISNLKKEDFIKSIGPSIASRLSETGGIVECNWGSFRDRKE